MTSYFVDVHIPSRSTPAPAGEHIDSGLSGWGRPELALALATHGVTPLFSRGKAYDLKKGLVDILRPKIDRDHSGEYSVTVVPETIALASIDAIRNVTKVIGGGVPELNHPIVRTTTRDKVITNRLLEGLKLAKAFAVIDSGKGIDESLDRIPGDQVVIKPRNGMRSQNIHIGSKEDIAVLYTGGELNTEEDWLLEERLDFSPPMPVRGLNDSEQAKINYANAHRLPKELRLYTFGRNASGQLLTSCVMRSARVGDAYFGNDSWVFIDPTSVPEEVIAKTDEIEHMLSGHTGVREMHLGVDWTFARSQTADDPLWLPMEVNSAEPQLVYEHENASLAFEQSHLLASQLYRIATRRSTL